jgi:hypothetical protein
MNLEDLEKTWTTQAVTGPTVNATEVAARLERELHSAQRRFTGMIVMAAGLLLLGWTMATLAHLTGIKRLTLLETTAHVTGSAFYLGWLALAVRSKRAVQREAAMLGGTTRDSAAASLRVVGLQIANYRIAAWSLPLAVAVAALLALAKFNRGELRGWGAVAAAAFVALLAGIAGAAMGRRYRRELKPRREKLRRTLGELGGGE